MPVRSSNSRVLKWPGRAAVDAAARALARRVAAAHPELVRLGYFGSYARGDQGVGSDLDLVAVVRDARRPFAERPLDFDTAGLPVPAELLVYTEAEWRALEARGERFAARLRAETVWVYP
jgi:hypothetical protein